MDILCVYGWIFWPPEELGYSAEAQPEPGAYRCARRRRAQRRAGALRL